MAKKNILDGIGDSYDALMGISEPKQHADPEIQKDQHETDNDIFSTVEKFLLNHPEIIQNETMKRKEIKSRRVTILVRPSLYEKIQEEAEIMNRSISDFINLCIEIYLKGKEESK